MIGVTTPTIESSIVESEEMVLHLNDSDAWSPRPRRPTQLDIPINYALVDLAMPCANVQEEDTETHVFSLFATARSAGGSYQSTLPDPPTCFKSSAHSGVNLSSQFPSERKKTLPNTSKSWSNDTCTAQIGKNLIDLDRIARGSDTRTTVENL